MTTQSYSKNNVCLPIPLLSYLKLFENSFSGMYPLNASFLWLNTIISHYESLTRKFSSFHDFVTFVWFWDLIVTQIIMKHRKVPWWNNQKKCMYVINFTYYYSIVHWMINHIIKWPRLTIAVKNIKHPLGQDWQGVALRSNDAHASIARLP